MERLPPRTARLHFVDPAAVTDPDLYAAYADVMSPDEREREARYHFDKHRRIHRVARALIRTTLSAYVGVDAKELRFEPNPWGRPELTHPRDSTLSWNVAHTDGLVVMLVADGCTVGVDVEDWAHRKAPLDVADRFFAPAEVAELASLPPERKQRRFFEYWTLKESYIKARGMGLALPLDEFAFDPRDPVAPTISFHGIEDDPSDWQFTFREPTEQHLVAAALKRGRGPDFTLEVQSTLPRP
ncbi:MAG: 4'-phosphopantetheinyl transferase superfamily protein [Polyangiaceae bacterium]